MWHVLHLIARPFEALLGVFCIVTATLLYPKEDGTIQSKLEDFWVRVDDYQKLALSRAAAFMTQVARFESRFLDRVFGHKLISPQALAVSFCCCYLTWTLSGAYSFFHTFVPTYLLNDPGLRSLIERQHLISYLKIVLPSLAAGLAILFMHKRQRLRWGIVIVSIAFVLITDFDEFSVYSDSLGKVKWGAELFAEYFGGFVCDVAFIALTRQLLRWAGQMTSASKVLAAVVFNLLVALFLVIPLFVITLPNILADNESTTTETLIIVRAIAITNTFDAAIALLFVSLALMFLIHRLVWPLLNRTLFRMTDIGTKGRRAILTAIGVALLSASVFGGKFPELLKDFVKIFGG
jgi:hypothetical protein